MIEQAELNRACFTEFGKLSWAKLFGRHGEPSRAFFPKARAKTKPSCAELRLRPNTTKDLHRAFRLQAIPKFWPPKSLDYKARNKPESRTKGSLFIGNLYLLCWCNDLAHMAWAKPNLSSCAYDSYDTDDILEESRKSFLSWKNRLQLEGCMSQTTSLLWRCKSTDYT